MIFLREKSSKLEVDNRLEKIITGKIKADILVFGSSRGARSVIASQISDSLHTSAYNLAFPGSDITFHSFLLEQLLKNKFGGILKKYIDLQILREIFYNYYIKNMECLFS